mgnify:CR=1 FL=1
MERSFFVTPFTTDKPIAMAGMVPIPENLRSGKSLRSHRKNSFSYNQKDRAPAYPARLQESFVPPHKQNQTFVQASLLKTYRHTDGLYALDYASNHDNSDHPV